MTDERPRAVLVLPGRGAYLGASLGSLPADHAWVQQAEAIRAELGLDSLLALDAADTFEPAIHLRPLHASPLTFLASLLDAERAMADHRVVAVIGNSLGWYTALSVSGALSFDDGFRLAQGIAILQEEAVERGIAGGQVIYPRVDVDWQPAEELSAAVDAVLADGEAADGERVYTSVDLGGYVVLAAAEPGVERLLANLPPVRLGERQFPLRLAFHGPYHTPLLESVASEAQARFTTLAWRAPEVTLIDGRGVRFTPWATSPAELAWYTLGEQLVSPYGFVTGARVALREYAPDVLVLTGPGTTLGGVTGQIVVAEGYHGIRTRADFEATQAGPDPLVLSVSR
ncbi:MAG TPA: ACP S-malonyltransferase [Candidatus Limnocylindria bacterium]